MSGRAKSKAKAKSKGSAKKKAEKEVEVEEEEDTKPQTKKQKIEKAVEADSADPAAAPVETDFTKPEKKPGQIKIISWNVAGFKAILNKGFRTYVDKEDPDILCVQETKVAENDGTTECLGDKYHKVFYAATKPNQGYAGTGIYSKTKPISVKKGLGIPKHDEEGRCITAEFERFYLVTTYIPNSGQKLQNLDYRTKEWDVDFLAYLKNLEKTKPVIWCGDLNVAHLEIDLANPKANKRKAGFTQEERDNFTKLLGSGFTDTFRHFKPNEEKAYTFWTYLKNARANDIGWRLDYFVVSNCLVPHVKESYIRKYIMGSDHAPIGLILETPAQPLVPS
eukprot:TRINITY_DN229_c0_g2_i1.p1 TRINITY_DN229_c0_g2~~TRINITY_DN229_c0_g2_i1.p1  ORF type:complete len:336 (-),score=113.46 TRINITY_DN229_c0_g2_i1:107-1114(-)